MLCNNNLKLFICQNIITKWVIENLTASPKNNIKDIHVNNLYQFLYELLNLKFVDK